MDFQYKCPFCESNKINIGMSDQPEIAKVYLSFTCSDCGAKISYLVDDVKDKSKEHFKNVNKILKDREDGWKYRDLCDY